MNLLDQIKVKFAYLSNGNASRLAGFEGALSSWVIKINHSNAVGILIDKNIKINETFANISYYTDWFSINGEMQHLLLLSCPDEDLRIEFAGVCAVFLETGTDNRRRIELTANPLKWWNDWKKLIGNKNVEKPVHGVLGELIILYYLKKTGYKINENNWTGPEGESVDITLKEKSYEVKTSLIKYNNIVTISSQFQLNHKNPLSLILVKLEDIGTETSGKNIVNIDYLLHQLGQIGFNKNIISRKISKLGFKEFSTDRKRQFRLLNITEYPVDSNFPYIDVESLCKTETINRILQLTYKIDLTGLKSRNISFEFN
ncbi:PD-(D/E)XK motif protein [Sporolactobacillus sp. THM19-2]|uniref:PD-(D/E)XK motif protein n=1 Tax=Sporolactobacillus sp. THM19-2 TaxID=2511171 RepID=UPI001020F2F1|nr:PD-(D/E)XK motif protein [Sporolactobacillus sp. THM19-2]RYL92394.1 PD-(D/E)XK motif protein [Sporolactobacillus sp. THM19-2]